MKTPLTYGFAMALAGAVLTFVMFLAGYHDTAEKMQTVFAQVVGAVVPLAIGISCLALAMREKRAETPADRDWGYGSALGTGVLTALFGSLIGLVTAYVYFAFINPHMGDVLYQVQVAKMEAKGASADQIERAEPMMRKFMTPVAMTLFQSVLGFIWGVILALIVAIFFRKRPVVAFETEVPPPVA